ncbi:MAG TPA: hypothetical protein VGK67_26965 [Myxococcales bacterium]
MFAKANLWTAAAALASALAAAPAHAAWEYVGVGDCAGGDTGSTLGAQPDQTRCAASTGGTAVVCWDDVQYRNAKARKPVCVYKRLQAAQCTGGGNPGLLYRCNADAMHGATAAAPPPPGPGPAVAAPPPPGPGTPPAAAGYQWRYARVGDCVGNDTASSKGALPSPERCGPGTLGQTAVCWDGAQYRHPRLGNAACIYKRTAAPACTGGAVPGLVYECAALGPAQPPHPAQPPQNPPPTAYAPPPAAPGYAWSYQRISDCSGGDSGSSRGPYPLMDRCDKATVGMSAVCWDGGAQRNKGFGYPACTYKRFGAAGCKGGASPGYLYECQVLAPGQPPPEYPEVQLPVAPPPPADPPPSAAPGFAWRFTRLDDCEAGEIGTSRGEDPSPEMCNEATVGEAAVCWDDKHHKHHKKKHASCSYKRASAASCYGGDHPGTLFECIRTGGTAYVPPPSNPPPTYQPAYSWRYLRNDGCHGQDEGSTLGTVPASDRCDASSVGQVSICWDGVSTRHPSGKVACSYKHKDAESCTGSEHPGALYECVASTVSAQPPPSNRPPAAAGYTWRYTRVDDCSGNDTGSTAGAQPALERCDAGTAGLSAVCWDGAQQKHWGSDKPVCAYKRLTPAGCTGGGSPGFLYECVSGTTAQPHPATPPPSPASLRYDWKSVGFGNCDGSDVGQTAGGAPLPAACDPSSVGKAAVCWSTSCIYKGIPASSCRGGSNSGTLYECVASEASAGAAPASSTGLVWNYVGVNDCAGNDTGSSAGSAPDPGRCGPATAGLSAVCWDGVQQRRAGSGTPVCAYKKVRPGDCRDGKNPGYVYRCGP